MITAADLLGIGSGLPTWPLWLFAACALPAAVLIVRGLVRRRAAGLLAAAEMGGGDE